MFSVLAARPVAARVQQITSHLNSFDNQMAFAVAVQSEVLAFAGFAGLLLLQLVQIGVGGGFFHFRAIKRL